MTSLRSRPFPQPLVCILFTAVWMLLVAPVGGAEELDAGFREAARSVLAEKAAMRAAWYGALGRLAETTHGRSPDDPFLLFRMSLEEAAYGKTLYADVCRYAGEFLPGNAWAPEYSKAGHHVEAHGLNLRGDRQAGKLKGVLRVTLITDGSLAETSRPLYGEISIDGTIEGGRISGDYVVTKGFSKATGRLSGTVLPEADTNNAPTGFPVLDTQGLASHPLYCIATVAEEEAVRIYHEIRSMTIARELEIAYSSAQRWSPLRLPVRPSFIVYRDKSGRIVPRRKLPSVLDSADSLFQGLHDTDHAPEPTPKQGDDKASVALSAAERLPTIRNIRRHVERLNACVQRAISGDSTNGAVAALPTHDPLFGPWYGFRPLAVTKQGVNVVPDDAGHAGPQDWPYIIQWNMLGPFACSMSLEGMIAAHLPEIVMTEDAVYMALTGKQSTQVSWRGVNAEAGAGYVRPWELERRVVQSKTQRGTTVYQPAPVRPGTDVYFYSASVYSPRDVQLPLAAGARGEARLWLNDNLLAAWPEDRDLETMESPVLTNAVFRKGLNRIDVRLRESRRVWGADWDSCFWVRLCTRGGPEAATNVLARGEAVAAKYAEIGRRESPVHGWRGNWNGVFVEAEPVTAWNIHRGLNVLWRTRIMPGESTPVIAEDRLLVMVEPNILVCLDKDSGKILWDQECSVLEWNSPEVLGQARVMYEALRQKWLRLAALGGRTTDEVVTALAERDNLSEDEARERLQSLSAAIQELRAKWWSFVCRNGRLPTQTETGKHRMPFSFPTPVTDGKHVWVKTGAGVTTCFDLKGRKKWMAKMPQGSRSAGIITSPILIPRRRGSDEPARLVMHLVTGKDGKSADGFPSEQRLLCLDAGTGLTLWWSAPVYNTIPASSPVLMTLTDGKEEMDVIVTGGGHSESPGGTSWNEAGVPFIAGGSVVRADDGKVLISNLGVTSGWGSPVTDGDVVYHFDRMCTATKLIMIDRDTVGAKRLWSREGRDFGSSVAKLDNVIYVQGGGEGYGWYHLFDAATGRRLERPVNVGTHMLDNWAYIPMAIAGGYVFVTDVDWSIGVEDGIPSRIKCFVLQPGTSGRVIARNTLEYPMTAPPVFEDGRAYVRSDHSVMCIGYTGDEGRAYEAAVNFRTLMEDLVAEQPEEQEPKVIAPLSGIPGNSGRNVVPRISLAGRPVHGDWAFAGPFPVAVGKALAPVLAAQTAGAFFSDWNVGTDDMQRKVWCSNRQSRREFQIKRNGRTVFDLLKLTGFESDTVGFFATVLVNPGPRTLRVRQPWPNIDIWIAGTPVKHMDRIALAKGEYPILVRATVVDSPDELIMDLLFDESDDRDDEVRRWTESIKANRAILERVTKYSPKSKLAKEAKRLLKQIEE